MAGPGWGHPEETLDSTLGTVLWKQAETGPRPHKEPHLTKGAPTQDSAGTVLSQGAGRFPQAGGWGWKARSELADRRRVGAPNSSAAGDSGWASPASTAQGISVEKCILGLRWLGGRRGELRDRHRLASPVLESIQGPFCPLGMGSVLLDAPSIAS